MGPFRGGLGLEFRQEETGTPDLKMVEGRLNIRPVRPTPFLPMDRETCSHGRTPFSEEERLLTKRH